MTQKNRWRAGAARATAARTAHATAATMTAAALLAAGALGAGPAAAVDGPVGNSSELPGASGSAAGSAAVDTLIPGDPLFNDPAADPFYQPPESIPAPGTVIRTQPAQHLLQMTGIDWPGTAEKIMYASTTTTGAPTAVTGVVFEPTAAWDGDGARPTIVVAPGTLGQGRQCAPSLGKALVLTADPRTGATTANYELITVYGALARGARVVMTDYLGRGVPGVHTYFDADDEAHAVLDAGRAALAHGGLPADAPMAIMGYSQGGGAAAAAAERAADYAPELAIAATDAGAPVADPRAVGATVDGAMGSGINGYALNGALHNRPELRPAVEAALTDAGRRFLASTGDECLFDTALRWAGRSFAEFSADGLSYTGFLDAVPGLGAYVDAQRRGRPGFVPDHPVMIDNNATDDAIPVEQARQLARDWCAQGAHVVFRTYRGYPVIAPGAGLGHVLPMFAEKSTELDFVFDALAGTVPPSTCGDL